MKTAFRCLMACGSLALAVTSAVAQADFSGHWEGAVDISNGATRLALDVAKDAKGVWIASLSVPDQKVAGLRATDIGIAGSEIRFAAPDLPGSPTFELTLADGKLKGALLVQALSVELEMRRTGDAKVDIAQPSPAVSKELEGDWEGLVPVPNGQGLLVIIHFKNQPDQTVEATIDSPAQDAIGLPLKAVVQKGGVVEFAVGVGGSYKGTLNKEGTQMAGEWTQRSGAPPVTLNLKKK